MVINLRTARLFGGNPRRVERLQKLTGEPVLFGQLHPCESYIQPLRLRSASCPAAAYRWIQPITGGSARGNSAEVAMLFVTTLWVDSPNVFCQVLS
jgi:hypothetical protein